MNQLYETVRVSRKNKGPVQSPTKNPLLPTKALSQAAPSAYAVFLKKNLFFTAQIMLGKSPNHCGLSKWSLN